MKVARYTSVKASGDLPDALRGTNSKHSGNSGRIFLDLNESNFPPGAHQDYSEIPLGDLDDNLPSISPSDMPSQVCKAPTTC